jgi:hypothetical protein
MEPLSQLERLLWRGEIALLAVLVFRLAQTGLARHYIWFYALLWVSLLQAVVVAAFKPNPNTDWYAEFYLLTQPLLWFLYIVTVLELYGAILREHPGIATLGRRTLMAGLVVAVAVSGLTLQADLQGPSTNARILVYYGVVERGIAFSLVVFLVIMLLFLARYPIPLKRNLAVHAIVYSVFFLSSALALFVMNVTGFEVRRMVSTALLAIADACLVAWLVLLRPAGEEQTVVLRQRLTPQDEVRLLEQLEALNASLSRSLRK